MEFCSGSDCSPFKEQMNALTAFIDASNVYGSDTKRADRLRSFTGGELLAGPHDLLPILIDGEETAGDIRAIENPALTSIHTVWLREHNRIARGIARIDRTLTDQEIYDEARRLVGAEMQNVVYGQW